MYFFVVVTFGRGGEGRWREIQIQNKNSGKKDSLESPLYIMHSNFWQDNPILYVT